MNTLTPNKAMKRLLGVMHRSSWLSISICLLLGACESEEERIPFIDAFDGLVVTSIVGMVLHKHPIYCLKPETYRVTGYLRCESESAHLYVSRDHALIRNLDMAIPVEGARVAELCSSACESQYVQVKGPWGHKVHPEPSPIDGIAYCDVPPKFDPVTAKLLLPEQAPTECLPDHATEDDEDDA